MSKYKSLVTLTIAMTSTDLQDFVFLQPSCHPIRSQKILFSRRTFARTLLRRLGLWLRLSLIGIIGDAGDDTIDFIEGVHFSAKRRDLQLSQYHLQSEKKKGEKIRNMLLLPNTFKITQSLPEHFQGSNVFLLTRDRRCQ